MGNYIKICKKVNLVEKEVQDKEQSFRLCLPIWRGREGKTWKKRNE